ncbi:hypothetical protein SAMN05444411_1232 [Lutibacter oricola]|uniref:Uncharacterized protein n=2 Tax=Lutibacter oricola TaxID=762486 RepID=A0A1H3H1G6_9FLAO|nr:hypothetical protein SAMN05444411_1232 [Lutibacter oricola]
MKKKKKHKKKKKGKSLNYKLFVIIGGIFHFIVYLLLDLTFYNDTIFWLSLILCGLILGIYFIKKMKLLNPESYRKIKGPKLKLYMFSVCLLIITGTSLIFGNVINGTLLGLNYIGKQNESNNIEYKIEKITQHKTGGRKRVRRNNPKVYFEKNGETIKRNLSEHYSLKKNYSEYKTIKFITNKGLLGFEIIKNYELKK